MTKSRTLNMVLVALTIISYIVVTLTFKSEVMAFIFIGALSATFTYYICVIIEKKLSND